MDRSIMNTETNSKVSIDEINDKDISSNKEEIKTLKEELKKTNSVLHNLYDSYMELKTLTKELERKLVLANSQNASLKLKVSMLTTKTEELSRNDQRLLEMLRHKDRRSDYYNNIY